MANKKRKKQQEQQQGPKPLSKEEKEMFSFKARAHDKYGNPVWGS